ncbi:class I SAM-dependent methyltransferase [bacterium]|nr:class I SAM-dependent methyltransferase [bacterium]
MNSFWDAQLNSLKRREIESVFKHVPGNAFEKALELGAGNGYQSGFISKYVKRLFSADLNYKRLRNGKAADVSYLVCDAENVDSCFSGPKFDLVFSSSLLEHLPRPGLALRNMSKVLKKDGILIHIIPNAFWKACHFFLFFPDRFLLFAKKIKEVRKWPEIFIKYFCKYSESPPGMGNNPKAEKPPQTLFGNLFWPHPHGAYKSNLQELKMYRRRRWESLFQGAGFRVIRTIPGPVSSGYGFGFRKIAASLESFGICSVFAYVAVKSGEKSDFARFFLNQQGS